MKPITNQPWVVLMLCLVFTASLAQHTPFKGANTIILSTHLADKEAYQTIIQVLAAHDILLSVDNDVLGIRSSTNSSLAKQGLVFDGHLSVHTGIVKLWGRVLDSAYIGSSGTDGKMIAISYAKDRNSWERIGFIYMDELARKLQSALQGPLM